MDDLDRQGGWRRIVPDDEPVAAPAPDASAGLVDALRICWNKHCATQMNSQRARAADLIEQQARALARLKWDAQMNERRIEQHLAQQQQALSELRRVAIQGVTANPGVLHHYNCLACGGRWSGRPNGPEKHADGCAAAAKGGA